MRNYLIGVLCALSMSMVAFAANAQIVDISYTPDVQDQFSKEYGEREKAILEESLTQKLLSAIEKNSLDVSRINLVVEKISPNHPTREQVKNTPGLDKYRSVSIGGAKITAIAYDLDGEVVATPSIDRFSYSIQDASYGSTWTDAKQAFSALSSKLTKELARK